MKMNQELSIHAVAGIAAAKKAMDDAGVDAFMILMLLF
jgi:hypothetical protein